MVVQFGGVGYTEGEGEGRAQQRSKIKAVEHGRGLIVRRLIFSVVGGEEHSNKTTCALSNCSKPPRLIFASEKESHGEHRCLGLGLDGFKKGPRLLPNCQISFCPQQQHLAPLTSVWTYQSFCCSKRMNWDQGRTENPKRGYTGRWQGWMNVVEM